ncbi:hypothetical protein H8356DRAFT_1341792 [Neocallimastix lanati (nom. inval.)]|nr:hypothetical protein H8356DRAFT_1341792 [Neocallimastix sp. JGI-2020a]
MRKDIIRILENNSSTSNTEAEEWNNKKETTEDKYDDPMAKDDYCPICGKHGHTVKECWYNIKNSNRKNNENINIEKFMGYINDIPLSSDCNNGLNYHELQKNNLEKPDDDIKSITLVCIKTYPTFFMDSNYELKYLFSCEEVNRLVAWVYQLKPIYEHDEKVDKTIQGNFECIKIEHFTRNKEILYDEIISTIFKKFQILLCITSYDIIPSQSDLNNLPGSREIGGSNWLSESNPYVYENWGRASFGIVRPSHYIWGHWEGRNNYINKDNNTTNKNNKNNDDDEFINTNYNNNHNNSNNNNINKNIIFTSLKSINNNNNTNTNNRNNRNNNKINDNKNKNINNENFEIDINTILNNKKQ